MVEKQDLIILQFNQINKLVVKLIKLKLLWMIDCYI